MKIYKQTIFITSLLCSVFLLVPYKASSNISLRQIQYPTSQEVVECEKEISGRVFVDANVNGVWDRGEKTIKNAGVSDGKNIVWTDRKGCYTILTSASKLFPILPDGYISFKGKIQNAAYINISEGKYDIALIPCSSKKRFKVAIVGDIQVDSYDEVVLARKTILSELAGRNDLDMMVHMGDLVNNKPSLFPEVLPSLNFLQYPVWTVIGNHDLDSISSAKTMNAFTKYIGNDVAAWFRGKVCFVMLNNVITEKYGLSDNQIHFLSQLLSYCKNDELIVLCQHVPMASTYNYKQVLNVLEGHKVLILSAHAHKIFRQEWTEEISEVSVGASCGSWWTGERDMWDVPIAIQQCGSPRNYFVFDFEDNDYSFSYKGVRLDSSIQADATIINNKLVVNVYGGGSSTNVEYSLNGGEWHDMVKNDQVSPYVLRMIYMNKEGGYPTLNSRRTPLRKYGKSTHIWEASLQYDGIDSSKNSSKDTSKDTSKDSPKDTSKDSLIKSSGKTAIFKIRVTDSKGLKPFIFYWIQ